jgi:hypothetical protein
MTLGFLRWVEWRWIALMRLLCVVLYPVVIASLHDLGVLDT